MDFLSLPMWISKLLFFTGKFNYLFPLVVLIFLHAWFRISTRGFLFPSVVSYFHAWFPISTRGFLSTRGFVFSKRGFVFTTRAFRIYHACISYFPREVPVHNAAVELLQITRVGFCRGKETLVWFSCGWSHILWKAHYFSDKC